MSGSAIRTKQSGIAMSSLLMILVILALVFSMVIKLVPVYLQHFNVVASLNKVAAEAKAGGGRSLGDIRSGLLRQFSINDVDLGREVVSVNTKNRRTEIVIDYEVRKPFLGNIDFVIHFHNSAEL